MKPLLEIAIEKIPDSFDPDEILPARAGHLVNLERRGFIAGAQWRINSVWHPINEDPGYGKYILVHFRSGNFTSWFASADILSDFKRFEAEGWAYVVDLLPADSE